jgi:chemotaxis protein MotB
MKNSLFKVTVFFVFVAFMSGCTFVIQKGRRSDMDKIQQLTDEVNELSTAKKLLEERLNSEIGDSQVKLQMMEKGLVITVVGDLLFDSGKDKIREEGFPILDKVGGILNKELVEFNVGIEGHTDNQPIKHSKWKSNWELSTARALSVLHFMVNEKGLNPERLSAIGYGEYRSVDSNDTKEGRHANRRVEIVVMPKITKVKGGQEAVASDVPGHLK